MDKDAEPESHEAAPPLGSHAIHIAAVSFEDAYAYLRWGASRFQSRQWTCLGLIEMLISGSPLH